MAFLKRQRRELRIGFVSFMLETLPCLLLNLSHLIIERLAFSDSISMWLATFVALFLCGKAMVNVQRFLALQLELQFFAAVTKRKKARGGGGGPSHLGTTVSFGSPLAPPMTMPLHTHRLEEMLQQQETQPPAVAAALSAPFNPFGAAGPATPLPAALPSSGAESVDPDALIGPSAAAAAGLHRASDATAPESSQVAIHFS
jgi:hypothetical protein